MGWSLMPFGSEGYPLRARNNRPGCWHPLKKDLHEGSNSVTYLSIGREIFLCPALVSPNGLHVWLGLTATGMLTMLMT